MAAEEEDAAAAVAPEDAEVTVGLAPETKLTGQPSSSEASAPLDPEPQQLSEPNQQQQQEQQQQPEQHQQPEPQQEQQWARASSSDGGEDLKAAVVALPQPSRRGLAAAMVVAAKGRWQRAKNAIVGLARWAGGVRAGMGGLQPRGSARVC